MSIDVGTAINVKVPADHSGDAMSRFLTDLEHHLAGRPGIIALDCSHVNRVSADHISSLCGAYQSCEQAGVAVRLESASPGLSRVLEVLDLDGLFGSDGFPTRGDRRRAFRWAAEGFRRMHVDQFLGDSEEVNRSSVAFLKYLKSLRLPEIVAFELQTVFYEVAMNIAAHAKMNDRERIVFTAEADDTGIVLAFTDSGVPFDLTGYEADFEPTAAGKERRKRGIGITMIRRLTDKVTYCRKHDSINVLTVEKHWGE